MRKEKKNSEEIFDYEKYETAYKKIKEQEAPDLWSRIEEGIDRENILSIEPTNETIEIEKQKVNRRKRYFSLSAVAAVIVLVFVTIPILSGVPIFNVKSEESNNRLQDTSESLADTSMEEEIKEESNEEKLNFVEESRGEVKNEIPSEELTDSMQEDSSQQNMSDTTMIESVEIVLDTRVNKENLVSLSFEDLDDSIQEVAKRGIKHYKDCKYYLDECTEKYYMEYAGKMYQILREK